MGSKGATQKYQTQTYTPTGSVGQAGNAALDMAQGYASSPFSTPVAPVAGFTPDQMGAFSQIEQIQGMVSPYFDRAKQLADQSASPISPSQVGNYLNPYASYALAGLNDTIGSQNSQLQGNLVQAAGGTGADRVAVAQSEKFKQDQLARGQLQAGFYQQALTAAQQDASRQGAAASLFGYLGPAHQNALLQGTGALLNTGGLQQQQQQAELNAPYANLLAQIQDPAMKSQFLAQLTGQLAPSQGGTTTGQSVTKPPAPNIFSQVAGLGMAGLGAYMGNPGMVAGGLGGLAGGSKGSNYGGSPETNSWLNPATYGNVQNPYGMAARGGRISPFAFGGVVDQPFQTMADGGDPEEIPLPRPRPPQYEGGAFGGMGFKPLGWDTGSFDLPREITQGQTVNREAKGPQLPGPHQAALPFADEEEETPAPAPQAAPPGDGGGEPEMAPGEVDTSSQIAQNPWLALAYAGAKTAAGTSPYAGVNLGAGLAGGIEQLGKQQTAALQSKRVDMEAKRLHQQMMQQNATLAETKRRNDETERAHREAEKFRALQPVIGAKDPVTGDPIYYVRDPKDGQLKPLQSVQAPGQTADGEPPKPDPAGRLGLSPEALESHAQKYLQTGMFPPNLRGREGKAMQNLITNRAMELAKADNIDPKDLPKKWQQFKSEQIGIQRFTSGPQGNTIRSLGVVVDHVATAKALALALQNGKIQQFNEIAQSWAERFGKPAPTNLDAAMKIVGPEIIKALGVAGAGTQKERDEAGKIISRSRSPEQIMGAVDDVVQPLLGGQLRGLRQQFKVSTGLGDEAFGRMLGPDALSFLEKKKTPEKTEKPEKIAPQDRFKQLIDSGKTKDEAYKTMRQEGY